MATVPREYFVRVRCAWLLMIPFALWWLRLIGAIGRERLFDWLLRRLTIVRPT